SRGLHSESWRWEGTHRQGCCLCCINTSSLRSACLVISQTFFKGGILIPYFVGILCSTGSPSTSVLWKKVKGPELGISGPALRGVGGGRGLTAKDAVCIVFILAISGLVVQ